MALIGALNTLLTTDTSQFNKKFEKAGSTVESFASRVGSAGMSIKTLGAALLGGAAVAGFVALTKAQAQFIDDTGDAAARIGVTTEALSSLRIATQFTGSEAENLDKSLNKLNLNLAEAQTGSGPAADALDRLGLKASELANLKTDEAFLRITDQFKELPSASDKATVAVALFGKSGTELINTLSSGSGKLRELQEEAKVFGNVFTDGDAAIVGDANDTIARLGSIFTGFANLLVTEVAPYITDLGTRFLDFAKEGYNGVGVIRGGLKFLAMGVGVVADTIHTAKMAFNALGVGATKILAVVTDGVWYLAKAIDSVTAYLPGFETKFADTVGAVSSDLHQLASDQYEELKNQFLADPPSNGIAKWFDDIADSAAKTKIEANQAAAAIGKASNAAVDKQQTARKNFDKWVLGLKDGLKTPLEKYREEIGKLDLAKSVGALDQKQYSKARKLQLADYLDATKQNEPRFAAALELGSKEARSAVLAATQGNNNDPLREQLNTQRGLLSQSTTQTNLLSELVRLFGDKSKEETDYDF